MATTLRQTDILFNDGTTQSTAGNPYVQRGKQVFTSSGTFTVPTGVTAVKVKLCGGGGAGASSTGASTTPGGTSSFGSYVSATGGDKAVSGSGGQGNGVNGDINIQGGRGYYYSGANITSTAAGGCCGGDGAYSGGSGYPGSTGILGGMSGSGVSTPATGYGNGGGKTSSSSGAHIGGGGGGYAESLVTGLTPGQQITVTVGAAGTNPTQGAGLYSGSQGIVIVEW